MFRRISTNLTGCGAAMVVGALALFLVAGSTQAKKGLFKDVFPLEDIKAGMKGYGLTVFSGTEREKFDVEVISVLHQFIPGQDLILVRCTHPVLDHAGVIAGMSGSPVYFDGKLAGAVAYAWRFGKDPIAGVTPAKDMLAYFDLSEVAPKPSSKKIILSKLSAPLKPWSSTAAAASTSASPAIGGAYYWKHFQPGGFNEISPLITPMTGSMLQGGSAALMLEKQLAGFFMMPVSIGSFPKKTDAAKKGKGKGKGKTATKNILLKPGDPVALNLVSGDISLAASGTVTAAHGDKVVAFGHPMFQYGQIEVPAASAYVHHCLASMAFSFKMTEPLESAGAMIHDRQSGIVVDSSRNAHVIPLRVHIEDKGRDIEDTWNMMVMHHRKMTSSLARTAVTSVVDRTAPDINEAVIESTFTIDVHDHKPLTITQKVFQSLGTLSWGYTEGLSVGLDSLMNSDFEEARIDGIEADISISYSHPVAELSGGYLSVEEAEEGERVDVHVMIMPHRGGSEQIYSTYFIVPQGMEGKSLKISIRSGDETYPETVAPHDLDDVIDNLSKSFPPDAIVVSVQLPAQGVSIGGKIIKNLPPSALDTLSPKAAYLGEQPEAVVERKFLYPGMLISGKVDLQLQVKEQ